MKHLIVALSIALVAGASAARASHVTAPAASESATAANGVVTTAATQPGTPQRSKMKTCNADARTRDVHGADRRTFMKQCLSGKSKPATAS